MTIDDVCGIGRERFANVADAAVRLESVGQLLAWARSAPALFASPGVLTDVVIQDEFTHDVVVALTMGITLVFAAT